MRCWTRLFRFAAWGSADDVGAGEWLAPSAARLFDERHFRGRQVTTPLDAAPRHPALAAQPPPSTRNNVT
jgi:hypothetical protein